MTDRKKQLLILMTAALLMLFLTPVNSQAVKGVFLYNLSNFTGTIPFSWPRVQVDSKTNEVYVIFQNLVRIFNESGMEIYSFGDELDLGSIVDIALDREGNILMLSHKWSESSKRIDFEITLCNYRGEPQSKIEIKNLPSEFSGFLPNRLVYRQGELYLASLSSMMVVVTDANGVYKEGYDIFPLLGLDEKEKANAMMVGFTIDREGNVLFTIPPVFRAYKLSRDREITYFGKPGSGPGRFNIVAGIVSDNRGNILVVDKLKGAIMVYDKGFNFLNQFSSWGYELGNLIAPDDIAIDSQDRIYVTQTGRRGVSVFKMAYE